jgi:hypothetical protein
VTRTSPLTDPFDACFVLDLAHCKGGMGHPQQESPFHPYQSFAVGSRWVPCRIARNFLYAHNKFLVRPQQSVEWGLLLWAYQKFQVLLWAYQKTMLGIFVVFKLVCCFSTCI